jgi:predicted transcriptional regulator
MQYKRRLSTITMIRLDPETKNRLEHMADQRGMKLSKLVRILISHGEGVFVQRAQQNQNGASLDSLESAVFRN